MFLPNIVTLREFYATALGETTRKMIGGALRQLWPAANGDSMLGIGYATPYLEAYIGDAAPLVACMPARQGAVYWPAGQDNRVLLAHESDLPFQENSFNRVLLVHCVESTEHLSWMMEEVWRVLTPGGRVLAVVPNRLGFWSRSSISPLGYGRPFSLAQMRDLMTEHHFTLTRHGSALFVPTSEKRFWWRMARCIEMLGQFFCPFIGGVWLVEAEKQVYASIKQPLLGRKRYAAPVVATQPAMKQG